MYHWGYKPEQGLQGPPGPPGPADINSLKNNGNLSELLNKPLSLETIGGAALDYVDLQNDLQDAQIALKADISYVDLLNAAVDLLIDDLEANKLNRLNPLGECAIDGTEDTARANIAALDYFGADVVAASFLANLGLPTDTSTILLKGGNLAGLASKQTSLSNLGLAIYNIDNYGADPSGAADSSAAINAAIVAATSSGARRGYVIFGTTPGSTYKVTGSAVLYSRVTILGNGAILLNAMVGGSYGPLVGVQTGNSATTFNQDILVRDLIIRGAPNGKQMTLAQMRNSEFVNVRFESNGDANNQFTISNTNIGLKFTNCYFESRDAYNIRISGTTSQVVIEDCQGDCNGNTFMLASSSTVKGVFVNRLRLTEMGLYLLEGSSCRNVIFEKFHIINSGANIGFGEAASLNSACVNIIMRDFEVESVAATFVNTGLIGNGAEFFGPKGYNAVGTGQNVASGGQIRVGRIVADQGTALAVGDVTLSAGWGAAGAPTTVTAKDQGGTITIVPNGVGIAANPTFTVTFKNGTWGNAPVVLCNYVSGGVEHTARVTATSGTAFTVTTSLATPIAGTAYSYRFIVMGR